LSAIAKRTSSSRLGFPFNHDQFSIGMHTQRFAYYASVDGDRSNLGLGTPVSQVIHDQSSVTGGFLSLLYNPNSKDRFW
jgi:hypothetical protein